MNEALTQLRAGGYPVREDVERLSPFIRKHLGCTAGTTSSCRT